MSKNNKSSLLSIQHEAGFNEEAELRGTPERNLLMAVLERAILDYVSQHQKDSLEAAEWIFDLDNKAEFSFSWLCSELDLDPEKVASDIKELPKRTDRHIAPWYQKPIKNQGQAENKDREAQAAA